MAQVARFVAPLVIPHCNDCVVVVIILNRFHTLANSNFPIHVEEALSQVQLEVTGKAVEGVAAFNWMTVAVVTNFPMLIRTCKFCNDVINRKQSRNFHDVQLQ